MSCSFINSRLPSSWHDFLHAFILMGFRGASLGIKFILMILMGRYFDLAEIGYYGLLAGLALIYSQLAGWGFGYNLNRHMVATKDMERQELLARQWGVFFYTYILTILVFVAAAYSPWGQNKAVQLMTSSCCVFIVISEHMTQELTRLLISTKEAMKGNIILFLRSAGWAIPLSAMLIFYPSTRNLEAVFLLWTWGGIVTLIFGFWWCRVYVVQLKTFITSAIHVPFSWLRKHVKPSMMVYMAFSINVLMAYLNRFTTGSFLTMEETGIYTLYWSIICTIYNLATTGFIQTAYPSMIECRHDNYRYKQKTVQLYRQAFLFSLLSGGVIGVSAPFLFVLIKKHEAINQLPIFYVMLLAGILRVIASVSFYVLYARHADKSLVRGMLVTLMTGLPLSMFAVFYFRLWGAAFSDVLYALVMFLVLYRAKSCDSVPSCSKGAASRT